MIGPVRYTVQREFGVRWYLVGGVGYRSLKEMRAAYPGATFLRIKATRRNRLFG